MKASLSQDGVELNERDFFKEGFSEAELRDLLGDTPAANVFSWRSPSARKLGLDRDTATDDELISLMVGEPRLITPPVDTSRRTADCRHRQEGNGGGVWISAYYNKPQQAKSAALGGTP